MCSIQNVRDFFVSAALRLWIVWENYSLEFSRASAIEHTGVHNKDGSVSKQNPISIRKISEY